MFGVRLECFRVSEIRMNFHLINRGNYLCLFDKFVEVFGQEIADADGSYTSLFQEGFQSAISIERAVKVGRQ